MQPKKSKYLKVHKNVQAKKKGIHNQLVYGQYGLKALKAGYLPAKTLETIKFRAYQMLSGIFILKLWQYFKMSVRKESSQMSLNTKKCIIRFYLFIY